MNIITVNETACFPTFGCGKWAKQPNQAMQSRKMPYKVKITQINLLSSNWHWRVSKGEVSTSVESWCFQTTSTGEYMMQMNTCCRMILFSTRDDPRGCKIRNGRAQESMDLKFSPRGLLNIEFVLRGPGVWQRNNTHMHMSLYPEIDLFNCCCFINTTNTARWMCALNTRKCRYPHDEVITTTTTTTVRWLITTACMPVCTASVYTCMFPGLMSVVRHKKPFRQRIFGHRFFIF